VAEFQEPVLKNATWRGQVYDFQISFNYTPVSVARTPDGAQPPAAGTTPAAGATPVAGQEAAAR
jgi:hypothetical protein